MRGPNLQGWGEWSGDPCSAGICSYKGYKSSTRSLGLHLLLCPSWEATAWGQQPNQTCVWEDLSTGTPWAISGSESVLTAWLGNVWGDSHPPVFPKKVTRGLIWPVPCQNTHSHLHHFRGLYVPSIPISSTLIFVILNQSHHSEVFMIFLFHLSLSPQNRCKGSALCVHVRTQRLTHKHTHTKCHNSMTYFLNSPMVSLPLTLSSSVLTYSHTIRKKPKQMFNFDLWPLCHQKRK